MNWEAIGAIAEGVGAVGVIVRSVSSRRDDAPHTGAMSYQDGVKTGSWITCDRFERCRAVVLLVTP